MQARQYSDPNETELDEGLGRPWLNYVHERACPFATWIADHAWGEFSLPPWLLLFERATSPDAARAQLT